MSNNESVPANIEYLHRCDVCGATFISGRSSAPICAKKQCRMVWAEFQDFVTLRSILENAMWAGAPTQEQLRMKYYIQQLQAACRQLAHSEEPLSRVLIEIVEDIPDIEEELPVQ